MKERPDETITVRLPASLREVIARNAEQQERTVSQQVRFWICAGIEAQAQAQQQAA